MLQRLQRGLEKLYRLEPELQVTDFVIDREARDAAGVARTPREQLLLQEDEDGLAIGLYFEPGLTDSLAEHRANDLVGGQRFGDFLLLLEGVSHFVYVSYKASCDHRLSALELELQAEVDKYVTCLLSCESSTSHSAALRQRLFQDIEYDEDLSALEQERYRVANNNALRYSVSLERRFVAQNRVGDMLVELRHFYRMSLRRKMQHIAQAA